MTVEPQSSTESIKRFSQVRDIKNVRDDRNWQMKKLDRGKKLHVDGSAH